MQFEIIDQVPIPDLKNDLLGLGLSEPAARVLSARNIRRETLTPSAARLDKPTLLPDMGQAVDLLCWALKENKTIAIETDFDCDGLTSLAVIYRSLVQYFQHPADKVRTYVGHRLVDGYGLSPNVMKRMIKDGGIDLVITADNGSADEAQIAELAAHGIKTIVTDHHGIPRAGGPESAAAFVSPARPESQYPDRSIAGCGVAFLTMWALRDELIHRGQITKISSISPLLQFVAAGTTADCVSLASPNNRYFVQAGLTYIREYPAACFAIAKQLLNAERIDTSFLGFSFGPAVNARSRVADPGAAARFMITDDMAEAEDLLRAMIKDNQLRKEIQADMTASAWQQAESMMKEGLHGLAIYLPDGHPGVNGIVAARIRDKTGRPTAIFSKTYNDETMLTGSARGGVKDHALMGLQSIEASDKDLFSRYGGHKGAAGMSIKADRIDDMVSAFDKAVKKQRGGEVPIPGYEVDGALPPEAIGMSLINELGNCEPFGMGCAAALWKQPARIIRTQIMGKEQNHMRLMLEVDGAPLTGVAFFHEDRHGIELVQQGQSCDILYRLNPNTWQGVTRPQAVIEAFTRT